MSELPFGDYVCDMVLRDIDGEEIMSHNIVIDAENEKEAIKKFGKLMRKL